MRVAIGADHAGFVLKNLIADQLRREGHEVLDLGTNSAESTDYPDYAAAVARDVVAGRAERGVLVCSTGIGMSIAANKVDGIRAAHVSSVPEAVLAREHNDANVLTLGARFLKEDPVPIVDAFLATAFEGGRHARRVSKFEAIEKENHRKSVPEGPKE